jgi:hypothetical protein
LRHAWLILIFAIGCSGFLHFQDHVREVTATASCCSDYQVTKLRWWAFRVQSCGAVSYWRCSTRDMSECCWPVETEDDATKTVAPRAAVETCWNTP